MSSPSTFANDPSDRQYSESQHSEAARDTLAPSNSPSRLQQRSVLELQLLKVRREADAARLDAQAAELEIQIRKLDSSSANENASQPSLTQNAIAPVPIAPVSNASATTGEQSDREQSESRPAILRIDDWQQVQAAISALRTRKPDHEASSTKHASKDSPQNATGTAPESQPELKSDQSDVVSDSSESSASTELRIDAPHPTSPKPNLFKTRSNVDESSATESTTSSHAGELVPSSMADIRNPFAPELSESNVASTAIPSRRKPAAWLVSTIIHTALILLLALVTLQTHKPSDQVSLSASASTTSEVSMETFAIETSELESEEFELSEMTSDVQYDLVEDGEVAVPEFKPAEDANSQQELATSMMRQYLQPPSSSAALTKPNRSELKSQFCGVDGGGNHFVYLVDSSKSMGEAFHSARIELIKAVNSLTQDQRFYVVFFDSNPDFMRLSNPNEDEPRSVYATAENKALLQRWAMRVKSDRGQNPNEVLEFLLNLKADAIFLLSDGEFPQSTEELLLEKNHYENLFGEHGMVSIVHTISYYSRAGESRMKRIAQQNQGQYRHVPKP